MTSPWLPEPRPRVKIGVHGALGLLVLVTLVTLTRELLGHVLLGVLHHLNTYTIISLLWGETILFCLTCGCAAPAEAPTSVLSGAAE